ncbi:MAG: GNAT family N-acetyltransferase [Methanomassiliicoccales archaeon]|nr:GNAT family N-acetyltransferase [Methanomassiliicoccales archaeon]
MSQLECDDVKCSTLDIGRTRTEAGTSTSSSVEQRPQLRVSRVRDYRDKYILRGLQDEARVENPGFMYLIEGKEKAKMVWVEKERGLEPVGYYIYREPRREFSKYAHSVVQFPMLFSQVYVRPEFRRKRVATRLVYDFINHSGSDTIWVESPKNETKALLNKLGYYEPHIRYELWQMMEGLSRWMKIENFVIRAKLVPATAEELRVWCGDTSVVLEDLR